jgi:hypothetical protein
LQPFKNVDFRATLLLEIRLGQQWGSEKSKTLNGLPVRNLVGPFLEALGWAEPGDIYGLEQQSRNCPFVPAKLPIHQIGLPENVKGSFGLQRKWKKGFSKKKGSFIRS